MPFDSEGNFSRLHNWEDDRINDIDIVTDHMDEEDDNFAAGLSECFLKNGLSKMKADFDAGNFKVRNVADGTTSLDAINKSQLDNLFNNIKNQLLPTGSLMAFAGSNAPDGWLICDGSKVSRKNYADLFKVIGSTYGSGDGSTTFTLPNFTNRTFWGGTGEGKYLSESLPNITGEFTPVTTSSVDASFSGVFSKSTNDATESGFFGNTPSSKKSTIKFDASSVSSVYQKDAIVRPNVIQTLICIKY